MAENTLGIELTTADAIEQLDRLLTEKPYMKKFLRKITSSALAKGRSSFSKASRTMLSNDPRQAYRAVRYSVYKSIVGGQINILNKRRAGNTRVRLNSTSILEHDPHHRGGNRIKRSANTERIDSYFGPDRGFILRFVNNGTNARISRYGNRGSIGTNNWFAQNSKEIMEQVSKNFTEQTELAINEISKL